MYNEKDEKCFISLNKTKDLNYLLIQISNKKTNEIYYLKNDDMAPVLFQKRIDGLLYFIEHNDNIFYIVTNYNSKNFILMKTLSHNTNINNWIFFEEEKFNNDNLNNENNINNENKININNINLMKNIINIDEIEIFKNFLIVYEKLNGLPRIKIFNFEKKEYKILKLNEEIISITSSYNINFEGEEFEFTFSSAIIPETLCKVNLNTFELNYNIINYSNSKFLENYKSERIFVNSKSNNEIKIPLTIFYKKNIIFDSK
jgi:oligopeptidase B